MSLEMLARARAEARRRPDLTAEARLALLSLGERSNDHGQHTYGDSIPTSWGATVPEAVAGLDELIEAGLVWEDPATGTMWLTFVSGWEQEWERQLWRSYPPMPRLPIPDEMRLEVYQRDGRTCVTCGSRSRLTVDHVWPVRYGGLTTLTNLATLCRSCNSRKGATVDESTRQSGWVLR